MPLRKARRPTELNAETHVATAFTGVSTTVHAEFSLPSAEGNEREVMERVAAAIAPLALPYSRLERLKTAVAEAAMNAIEHGNGGNAELPVGVHVESTSTAVTVRITDQGGATPIPAAEAPDIEAKLAGKQKPRMGTLSHREDG